MSAPAGLGRAIARAVALVVASALAARAEPLRTLPGMVPRALASMEDLGPAPADLRLHHVTVFLGLRNRETLDAIVAAQQDRRSARFHRWLDAEEIADRFGPRRAEYERVRHWFVAHGFEVVRDSPFRITVVVAGTAAQVEAALATPIGLFRRGGETYRAPRADPSLPESLAASVRGMIGLDDLPAFRPLHRLQGVCKGDGVTPCFNDDGCPSLGTCSVQNDTALAPDDFAKAYGVQALKDAGLDGTGRTIAVLARSNFPDSDVTHFSQQFVPARTLAPVRVLAGTDPGILADPLERVEVLLDTQWAGALAPGAQVKVVIAAPQTRGGDDIPGALDKAIRDRTGDIISLSFGLCEPTTGKLQAELFDAFYTVANAGGQTVLVAAGDNGAFDCAPDAPGIAVSGLASSPHAVAVGGTSFALDADGKVPANLSEAVWNDGPDSAGGGGRSIVFGMPRYQVAAGLAPLSSSRTLPDLAVAGSPATPGYVIIEDGEQRAVGGTSAGVPALAGALALVAQRFVQDTGAAGLGQLLPELYRIGSEQFRGIGPPVFRDVTTGSNGAFAAGPGFDLTTGWGAPQLDALAATVRAPGRCEPELPCLVPTGRGNRACAGEWLVEQELFTVRNQLPTVSQTCRDGDAQCDVDATADGQCTIRVALCLNVFDFRTPFLVRHGKRKGLPRCRARRVRSVTLLAPRASARDPVRNANHAALVAAIAGLPDVPTSLANTCTAAVPVVVPAGTRLAIRARVGGSLGTVVSRLRLGCTS